MNEKPEDSKPKKSRQRIQDEIADALARTDKVVLGKRIGKKRISYCLRFSVLR